MSYVIEFIKTIFPDTTIAFYFIALSILTFWMYKELRNSHLENNKNNQQRTDKAIDLYADVELEIYKFLNNKSDFFNVAEKMSKASSLMPYQLLKKCNQCKEEPNVEQQIDHIKNLHDQIKKEIVSLKIRQSDSVTFKSDDNVIDFVENYVKTKVVPFILPLVQTTLNIIFLLMIIFTTIFVYNEPSTTQNILNISLIFVAIFYLMVINIIISAIIMKRRFKHSVINWLLFLLFAIVPAIFIFIGPWYRGIILIVLMFVYAFYAVKKSIKENPQ